MKNNNFHCNTHQHQHENHYEQGKYKSLDGLWSLLSKLNFEFGEFDSH